MAQHGTTLVWSCVLQELRPQRPMAATKGPSSWPDYIGSDGATRGRCTGCAVAGPRRLGDWQAGRRVRDRETEEELLLSVPLRQFSRHTECYRPALHQRLPPELEHAPSACS